jgi:Spy/CpxP family protein refolding chaperone
VTDPASGSARNSALPNTEARHRAGGKVLAIVAFATVAIAGVLSGAALDRYVLYLWGRPGPERGEFRPDRRGGGGRGAFGEIGRGLPPPEVNSRLMRELDLSPAQRAEIDSLLDRQAAKLREVRERVRPEIDSLVAETEREMSARFTPEQRKRYDSLRKEMRPPSSRSRRGGPR